MIGKASYPPGITPLRSDICRIYTLSENNHDKDYPVMMNGEYYGTVRETRCYSRLEYRALMPDGDYIEPVSDRVHDSPLSAVCELARSRNDQELADRLTDYIIEVLQVRELAAIQLRKNTETLLGVDR